MKTKITALIAFSVLIFFAACEKEEEETGTDSSTSKSSIVFNPDITYGSMTDQDGNEYKTVTIGTQTWMAENLRSTTYNNGVAIPNVTDYEEWGDETGEYCVYDNSTSQDTITTYGNLYNWYAVNTGNLAPKGWHIPTKSEWITLFDYLGGADYASSLLKETGTTHWISPNSDATNESGFTALPGGIRNYYDYGQFEAFGSEGYWWSTTVKSSSNALCVSVSQDGSVKRISLHKGFGFSVRCIMD